MSINKHRPHILVLPEDDANRQIANGFILNFNINERAIQVLPIADGWKKAVDKFTHDHALEMRQYPERRIVLLIDFDKRENRFSYVEEQIPEDLKHRVFVLGVQSKPESLRNDTKKTFENIGETLAEDCIENKNELWRHRLLEHNQAELKRMIVLVKPFLFN